MKSSAPVRVIDDGEYRERGTGVAQWSAGAGREQGCRLGSAGLEHEPGRNRVVLQGSARQTAKLRTRTSRRAQATFQWQARSVQLVSILESRCRQQRGEGSAQAARPAV